MPDFNDLFARLAKSKFRSRMRLGQKERDYVAARGMPMILAPAGRELTEEQKGYVVGVIGRWLSSQEPASAG